MNYIKTEYHERNKRDRWIKYVLRRGGVIYLKWAYIGFL